MYKILFIDEQKESHDDFLDYVELYPDTDIEVEPMLPCPDMDKMTEVIIEKAPDAIIVDFRLNDNSPENIPYNGVELVNNLQSIRNGFPCFIMTTFDNEAVHYSDDVNIVYVKKILHNPEKGTVTFLDRVKEQIRHYKTRISNAETELQRLLELRKSGEATIDDEARLIELDDFLEKAIDGKTTVPSQYKTLSNAKHLASILAKADELIKKLEENK